ncbi:hypothetical protein LTR17_000983 [Elasticomyces elasticus]|nr:hypothetical protein LTR17_000983 [Elasticomyces elasticus]
MDAAMDTEPTSAATKVFATFELLELILLKHSSGLSGGRRLHALMNVSLDVDRREDVEVGRRFTKVPRYARMPNDRRTALRALLVNQRVNRDFAAVIRNSPDLREALFFDHEKQDRKGRFMYRPFANTLLDFLDCYSPMDHLHTSIEWNRSQDEFPNLLRFYRNGEKVQDYEASEIEVVRAQTEASSWRKMLLLSQPVKVVVTTIMPNGDDLEDVVMEAGTTAEILFGASFRVPDRCRWWIDDRN